MSTDLRRTPGVAALAACALVCSSVARADDPPTAPMPAPAAALTAAPIDSPAFAGPVVAPDTTTPVGAAATDEDSAVEKPVWVFWLVTGIGLVSLAEGGAFFVDYLLVTRPALETAQKAYDNPDVVCPGRRATKDCLADQIGKMETAGIADLSIGSFFSLVGIGAIAGALLFLYPYGE